MLLYSCVFLRFLVYFSCLVCFPMGLEHVVDLSSFLKVFYEFRVFRLFSCVFNTIHCFDEVVFRFLLI